MSNETQVGEAFRIQAQYCRENAAPMYARVCEAIAARLTRASATGACVLDWAGEPTRDALPLRLMGGLHALVRGGADEGLAGVFASEIVEEAEIAAAVEAALAANDDAVLPWLGGPPQTNEPGRSGALVVGLLEVARRFGPKLELLEIGSSGGLNLLIDRFRFDLGGAVFGPTDAAITIRPEWRGPAPEVPPIAIVSTRGCDVAPMDVTDPAIGARLAAYVWPEVPERLTRLEAAVGLVRESPVRLDRADAADWVEAQLAEPQANGVTRVLMHSVVWQYLPEPVAERIRVAMAAAGERAKPERPLAWVTMEPDRALAEQVVSVRCWPGEVDRQVVATSHAHAAWVQPGNARAAAGIDLPVGAKVRI
jgi:hypothetical protein